MHFYGELETEWAAIKYEENASKNELNVSKKGKGFDNFKSCFGEKDRGYGYIRILGGDEVSKRPKFIFVTYCGDSVPAMQKVTYNRYVGVRMTIIIPKFDIFIKVVDAAIQYSNCFRHKWRQTRP